MTRNKEFNEELVIDKAVEVFWAKGYESTSIQDLVDAMNIQRGSLYATFGSKQQLFLKCLKQYGKNVVNKLLDILHSKPSAIESIELFFSQLVEHLLSAGPLRSCLVTNSAIERSLTDKQTRLYVLGLLNNIKNKFLQTLERARNQNEISNKLDLYATANYLTSSMQGLLVMGKVNPEKAELEQINQVTLSILKH